MASNKKRVSIGLTDAQYALVQKFAKEKGFSKSAIFVLALEEYARKESGQKNKQKSIFVGKEFLLKGASDKGNYSK